ncbi:FAD-dependent oxidoreductase [Saccharopolyspora shandongensis]|uniref:FAD-dependent oxidoreductase n=1 Tax=Saccharopolyspora shandongensis TaxID=418495 RepID=UPI0033C4E557
MERTAGAVFRDREDIVGTLGQSLVFAVQTVLIGIFVAPRLKRYLGTHTVGDVMEHHYGRASRLVTAEPGTRLAGFRPSTPDSLPIIGPVPGADGVFAASGHGMLGLTLARRRRRRSRR